MTHAIGTSAMDAPGQSGDLRLAHRLRGFQPIRFLVIGTAVFLLLALIAYPLLLLAGYSIIDADGNVTLSTFERAFAQRGMVQASLNSAYLVTTVTIGSLLLGIPLAWLVARTNTPGKLLVTVSAGIAFVIPTFISVISWIYLAAPNSGSLNRIARQFFGATEPVFNIMSFNGLIFIEIAGVYPLVFFAVVTALNNVDASNEQAARILGAGRLRTALTITLPLVRPAILTSAILVAIDTLSSFGAPAAIGTMANFSVLTTRIFDLIRFPPQFEFAAAVSMPIVIFTFLSLLLQKYAIRSGNFRTLTGKAVADQVIDLGPWRWVAFAFCMLVVAITAVLPLGALLLLSFLDAFGAAVTFENLVARHYRLILDPYFVARESIVNSLVLAFATATACALLGLIFGWVVERIKFFGNGAISLLIMIAYGFPSIAYAVGIMMGYIHLFYGTLTLILIAYAGKLLPIAFVLIRTGIQQLSSELEEAARIAGAGWLRSLKDVTFPLMKGAVGIAWVLVFSLSLRELSIAAILSQANSQVMPTVVVQFIEDGAIELAAALSVFIVTISISILVLVRFFSRKNVRAVS